MEMSAGTTRLARRAPLGALLTANAISPVGNVLTFLAIPWFVLETTGSAAKTGLVGVASVLPAIVAAFFGGAVVDRLGFKWASIAADVLSGVAVALVPLLHRTVGLAFWHLLVLVFLGALLDAPGGTARDSLLPDLVALARLRPERANTAYAAIGRLAQLLGPLAAGLLIAWLGASNVLWVDAASFAISAGLIATAVPKPLTPPKAPARYLDEVREGLRFVWGNHLLRSLAAIFAIGQFLDAPLFAVVLPVYAKEQFGSARDLGLVVAGAGAGSLAGLAIFWLAGHRLPRRDTFVAGYILFKLPWWVLVVAPPLPVAVAAIVASGVAAAPIGPLVTTVEQERVPIALRGRVFGTLTAITLLVVPLGMLLTGYLVAAVGVRAALLINTACYQTLGISTLFDPALREMGTAPTTDACEMGVG